MTLLDQIRASISDALTRRAAEQDRLDAVVTAAEAEERTELTAEETATFAEARAAVTAIDAELDQLRARETELVEIAEARAAADAVAASLPERPATTVRVGREELTYRQGGEHSFLEDAFAARFFGDSGAQQRLARHGAEVRSADGVELRDVGTSAFGALVVPQYLTDLFAPTRRAGRPLLDVARAIPLPDEGMTVNIPRATTGTAVAVQATENSGAQETDFDETTLAVSVRTFAGQQDISRQSLERGRMVEQVIFGDLISAYHAKVDYSAIADDGTSGTHLGVLSTSGINAVTYTDASPTVAEAVPKIADAIQRIQTNHYGAARLVTLMHPRRWGWFLASVDSSNRPLVVPNPNGPFNSVGVSENVGGYPSVGSIMGVPVVLDANIPVNLGGSTNEDRIIVLDADEAIIMEEPGSPLRLRFDETTGGSLTVKVVVYGYSAFTAGRYPASVSVISGTGLATPSF